MSFTNVFIHNKTQSWHSQFKILRSGERFEKLRFRDGLLRTAGLTVEIDVVFKFLRHFMEPPLVSMWHRICLAESDKKKYVSLLLRESNWFFSPAYPGLYLA